MDLATCPLLLRNAEPGCASNPFPVPDTPPNTPRRNARARVLALLVAALLLLFATGAGAVVYPTSTSTLRLSHMFGSGQTVPNLDTALKLARTHAILRIEQVWQLGYDGTWDGTVADTYYGEMKAANPQLVIFKHLNPVYGQTSTFPESWYLHDSAKHRLWNTSYKNYLMNPRSTAAYTANGVTSYGWVSYLVNLFKSVAAKAPGVFNGGAWFDDVGGTPHVVDAVTGASASAVDADGTTFTTQEWYDLTTSVVAKVQAAIGGSRAGNALLSAYCYYTGCGSTMATSWFFTQNKLDESMAEGYLRNWWADPSQFYAVADWEQSVQMLIDANALGKYTQVTTALPTTATTAQRDQWRKYAWATYLLGNNGRAYFEFDPYGCGCWETLNSLYSLDIGSPSVTATKAAGYKKSGGWYERAFTKGKVIINPGTSTITVPLGGTYLLPTGTSVTSVTLAAHRAEILRLSGTAPAPTSTNLIPNGSFEGTLVGWGLWSAKLSLTSGGAVGSQAARVTRSAYSTYGLFASPAPLTSLSAGAVYRGGGWVRSATPGRKVCLVLREKKLDGTLLYSQSCVTGTSSWQAFPTVTRTVAATGSLVDFYVYQSGAVSGDSFDVDGLTLTKG